MAQVIVEESIKVPTGSYQMTCSKVLERQTQGKKDKTKVYDFVDYYFDIPVVRKTLEGEKTEIVELKLSYFKDVRENSPLMKFLKRFGVKIVVGQPVELTCVTGRKIKADVTNPKNEFGNVYSEISEDSIEVI